MLDLRRLRYFVAVAAERNFTRAAERVHVAQPALSRSIRQLEAELGVELLRRTTHTVELTEAGEYLLRHGGELLRRAEALDRSLREFGAGQAGGVVVAYGTSSGYETAPRLLAAVAARLPALSVATRVLGVEAIVAGIAAGTVDVGIVRCPPAVAGVESWLLRREAQGVLVVEGHRLASAADAGLDELGDETVLLHPRDANPGHFDAVVTLLRDAGVEPRLELRDVSVDLQHTPVLEGRAVAIVGESTRVSVPPRLTWVPLRGPALLPVCLLARALNRGPAVNRFLEAAQAAADELRWRR